MKTRIHVVLAVSLIALIYLSLSCGKDEVTNPKPDERAIQTQNIDTLVASILVPDSLISPPDYQNVQIIGQSQETLNIDGHLEVWNCIEFECDEAYSYEQYVLLRPNTDVIWPGAALQGNSIRKSSPNPITAKRGPGAIVINNITGTSFSSKEIPEMKLSAVVAAQNEIISAQSSSFPAFFSIGIQKVRAREELQLNMQASASFFFASAAASFDLTEKEEVSRFLVTLHQSFYTMIFERPSRPSDFWSSDVTADELATYVKPGNPPVYISQVNYGRIFYLLIESTSSSSELAAAISADFIYGDVSASVHHVKDCKNLKIQAFAIGGNQEEAITSIFSGLTSLQSFLNSLKAGNQINLAVPLSYSVRTVNEDKLVRNGFATHYTYTECEPSGIGPCVPTPLSPVGSQELPNGCSRTSIESNWTFQWNKCPGATDYQLVIRHSSFDPFKDVIIPGTNNKYSFLLESPFTEIAFESGWSWRVRAKIDGAWGDFSTPASFKVEPLNSRCKPSVILYQHPNYLGDNRVFREDYNDLDRNDMNFADVASSVKLNNVRGVWLYDGRMYTGGSIYISSDVPGLRQLSFNDRIGSLKIDP